MIDIASGVGWLGMAPGNKATVVFQTGFTGSTGCVISYNPVILSGMKKPQMKAPRVTPLEGVSAQSNRLFHRKGREERKAEEQKSLRPLRSLRLIEFHGIPTAQEIKKWLFFRQDLQDRQDASYRLIMFILLSWRINLNEAPCPPRNRLDKKRAAPAASPHARMALRGHEVNVIDRGYIVKFSKQFLNKTNRR